MVLKIDRLEAVGSPPPLPPSEQSSNNSDGFDHPLFKKTKPNEEPSQEPKQAAASAKKSGLVCAGCKISEKDAQGSLLLFDDPEEEDDKKDSKSEELRSVFTSDFRCTSTIC